jgi:hypothetical protein
MTASTTECDGCDCTHIQLAWSQPPSLSAALNFAECARSFAHDAIYSDVVTNDWKYSNVISEGFALQRSSPVGWSLVGSAANLRC